MKRMNNTVTWEEMYAYALGYYYGRSQGNDPDPYDDETESTCRHYYKEGYQSGVSDYCDEEEQDYEDPSDYVRMGWVDSRGRP